MGPGVVVPLLEGPWEYYSMIQGLEVLVEQGLVTVPRFPLEDQMEDLEPQHE